MRGTTTETAQAVRYWLTPAGCLAAGGHVGSPCAACGVQP